MRRQLYADTLRKRPSKAVIIEAISRIARNFKIIDYYDEIP